jgi:hypothetical protein
MNVEVISNPIATESRKEITNRNTPELNIRSSVDCNLASKNEATVLLAIEVSISSIEPKQSTAALGDRRQKVTAAAIPMQLVRTSTPAPTRPWSRMASKELEGFMDRLGILKVTVLVEDP